MAAEGKLCEHHELRLVIQSQLTMQGCSTDSLVVGPRNHVKAVVKVRITAATAADRQYHRGTRRCAKYV